MTDGREFDIYQTSSGYTAVTNATRRTILDELKDGERDLSHLMKATGKSKPTLSNIHMRELIEARLIEELPHPTDARRKLYRLAARRIGSSDVPLDQLRGAVKHYVSISPLAYSIPFPTILAVLSAEGVQKESLRALGRELGKQSSGLFTAATPRDVMTSVAAFWEREGIANPQRLDFDELEAELELTEKAPKGREEALALVLAGILEGILSSRSGIAGEVRGSALKGRRIRLQFKLSKPA